MKTLFCSLKNLSFHYALNKPILKQLNLDLHKGECLAILGGSGSGKSTLGHLLAGFLTPSSGELTFYNQDKNSLNPLEKFRQKQMVFQDPASALTPFYTPFKTLYEVIKLHFKISKQEMEEKVKKTLTQFGLAEAVFYKKNSSLSGGEKQRLVMARAFCLNPELLILDEPVSSCDILLQKSILSTLKEQIKEQGTTVVIILHDIHQAMFIADTLCLLHEGQIEAYGSSKSLLSTPQSPYTEKFIVAFS
jgi:peptide/nickel transport system ATP-binding protein